MILAVSRFKVANGMRDAVAHAFRNRPRFVDKSEGFLGMEVLTNSKDPSVFYVYTRWVSESAFHEWHKSEAHRASHEGIPKGLKLDPTLTQTVIMESLCH